VARFQEACRSVVVSAHERGARVVFVGGTGLYHRAVVDGLSLPGRYPLVLERLEERSAAPGGIEHLYGELARLDPPAAARVTPTNRRRILRALEVTIGSGRPFSSYGPGLEAYRATPVLLVGLGLARDELDRRLAERLSRQMESGFLDEVRALLDDGVELSRTARQAIGYKELIAHLEGRLPLEEAIDEISRRLRAFARRQESWFRRDPRVHWFDAGSPTLADDVLRLLKATGDVGEPCETRTS
jgi:tRNA dimethylallyltransferase